MERPNRGRSNLMQAMGIATAAVFSLLWAYSSPAGVLLLGLLVLSYFNYSVGGRDVLYPAFTFTAIWATVIIVYLFCPIEVRPIGWKTISILLGGTTSFSVGSLIGNRPFVRRAYGDTKKTKVECDNNPQARLLLLAYTILAVPLVALDTQRLVGEHISFSPRFFIALRNTMNYIIIVEGKRPYSSRLISTSFMIAGLTFFVFIMEEKRKWVNVLFASCLILLSLLNTGRAFLMQELCGWFCLALLRRKDRSFVTIVRWSSVPILGVIILMAALTFLTKSETQGENGLQVASDMTFEYMVGPIAAFDYAVYHPEQFREQPAAVFAEVLERLSTLRLIHYTPPDNVGVHVDVPFGTNVYTCFMPYYEDFGAAGCFLFFTLFGLVEGYVFYAAARGNNIAAFVLAYLSYSLMFSVFADSYHFVMGYLYLFAYIVVYFYFLKRIRISGSVIRIRISQPPATE